MLPPLPPWFGSVPDLEVIPGLRMRDDEGYVGRAGMYSEVLRLHQFMRARLVRRRRGGAAPRGWLLPRCCALAS